MQVGFVSKSGGMSNELYNVIARAADGIFEGALLGLWQEALWRGFVVGPAGLYDRLLSSPCRPATSPQLGAQSLPPKSAYTNLECICRAGIAIGGDAFPGSTLSDHCLRYQHIPQVC